MFAKVLAQLFRTSKLTSCVKMIIVDNFVNYLTHSSKILLQEPSLYSNDTRQLQDWAIADRRNYDCENFFEVGRTNEIVSYVFVMSSSHFPRIL